MSRTFSAKNSDYQKQSSVDYQAYFHDSQGLWGNIPADISGELEAELLKDSDQMRREFRRLARKMRNQNA